jgi:hypothetical protein
MNVDALYVECNVRLQECEKKSMPPLSLLEVFSIQSSILEKFEGAPDLRAKLEVQHISQDQPDYVVLKVYIVVLVQVDQQLSLKKASDHKLSCSGENRYCVKLAPLGLSDEFETEALTFLFKEIF